MNKWINADKKLPKEGEWVLSFTLLDYIIPRPWNAHTAKFEDGSFQMGCNKQPTHWMPLPEPPNE